MIEQIKEVYENGFTIYRDGEVEKENSVGTMNYVLDVVSVQISAQLMPLLWVI